jgi:hypothetical protein
MTHVSPVTWYARTNGNVFGGPRCCGKASTLYHVATMIACGWNRVPFPAMIFLGDGQIRGLVPRAHPHLVPIRTSVAGVAVRTVPIDQARWNEGPGLYQAKYPPWVHRWSNRYDVAGQIRHASRNTGGTRSLDGEKDVIRAIAKGEWQRLNRDSVKRGSDDEASNHRHDCVRQLGLPPHGLRIFVGGYVVVERTCPTSKRHIHSFIPVRSSQTIFVRHHILIDQRLEGCIRATLPSSPLFVATEKRH